MSIRYIDSCYKIIVEGTFAAEGTDINNSKFSVDPLKGGSTLQLGLCVSE